MNFRGDGWWIPKDDKKQPYNNDELFRDVIPERKETEDYGNEGAKEQLTYYAAAIVISPA
jgi:hypothetical protein